MKRSELIDLLLWAGWSPRYETRAGDPLALAFERYSEIKEGWRVLHAYEADNGYKLREEG